MKKSLLLFFVMGACAFMEKNKSYFNVNDVKKNYVRIKPDLYVSKFEVSNADYRNFLAQISSTDQSGTYQKYLPDTICWKEKIRNAASLTEHYFRYPAYDNYPLVGVTYEAAQAYCLWLTSAYNQDRKRKFSKVMFRLLSREEWMYAANKGDASKTYTWGSGFMQNNRKQDLCNFRHTQFIYDSATKKYTEIPAPDTNKDVELITANIIAYYPSSSGLYNMCGNVAEMVQEKGIASGGSYDDGAYYVRIASKKTYTKPQADIGIRVAMQVLEN